MKKMYLTMAGAILLAGFTACNGDTASTTTTTSDNTTVKSPDSSNAMSNDANNTPTTPKMPFSADDSIFVMKAAMGGIMEVEAGEAANQNGENARVKNFGAMLIADHSKANSELMGLAAQHGLTVPTMLPADKQKHVDDMMKMKAKAFDKHFISMMSTDHKKDIALFEKQASGGGDPDLKAFAAKTLPTLKMHMDTVQALSKMKM